MTHRTLHSMRAKLERSARDLLYGTRAFFQLRSAYQLLFNREKLAFRRKMRRFYSDFVHRGDLVFDVGANIGLYSEVFTELGAEVVAVEPNPPCCENLHRLARRREVHVRNCAAGDKPGRAILRVCADPGLSTLTGDWFDAAQRSPLHREAKW